jgi:hypothetical protein
MIPTVIMVGADKGGVGKTMLTRALVDYLDDRKAGRRAFDCQSPNGDLKRFCVDADIVDIGEVSDQMKVFDGVDTGKITVLDLPAGLLSPTLQALDDAKLLDDVRAERMRLVLLHVLGPTLSSIAEIGAMAQRVGGGGAKHFLVKNHINQAQFFEWDGEQAQAHWRQMGKVTIDVPQLTELACETVQKVGGSFADFAGESGAHSRMLRGLVRTWLDRVWGEFDRVGLKEIVAGG